VVVVSKRVCVDENPANRYDRDIVVVVVGDVSQEERWETVRGKSDSRLDAAGGSE
jgi:hypothetical protein